MQWRMNQLCWLSFLFLLLAIVQSAPTPEVVNPPQNNELSSGERQSRQLFYDPQRRIFFNSFGDIIQNLPFLPIEINVPDALSNIGNYISGFFPPRFGRPNPNVHPRIEPFILKNDDNKYDHRLAIFGESRQPEIQQYGMYGLINHPVAILGKNPSEQNVFLPQYPIQYPFWFYYVTPQKS